MEINKECTHNFDEEMACILCGKCKDYGDFKNDVIVTKITGGEEPRKYQSKQNKINKEECLVDSVLKNIKMTYFKDQVLNLLDKKTFVGRVNPTNRILIVSYVIAKQNNFPLTFTDIQPFTDLKKARFLRVMRNSFNFVDTDETFLKSIYNRAYDILCERIQISTTFKSFLIFKSTLRSSDCYLLCIGLFLFDAKHSKLLSSLPFLNDNSKAKVRRYFVLIKKCYNKLLI